MLPGGHKQAEGLHQLLEIVANSEDVKETLYVLRDLTASLIIIEKEIIRLKGTGAEIFDLSSDSEIKELQRKNREFYRNKK